MLNETVLLDYPKYLIKTIMQVDEYRTGDVQDSAGV